MHTITQDVLLSVLAIARPAPFLPSVCQDWTCLCQSESHIRRSWLHQLVFKSQLPLSLTDAKAFANSDAPIPRFQQFLMSRLPNGPNRREYRFMLSHASAMAPMPPLADPLLRETIVADFLGPSGLFAREQSLAVTKCPLETPLEAALSNWLETSSRCTQRWHPVSDSIMFVLFLLRTGDTDRFRHALPLLTSLHPTLATEQLPVFHWAQLMLDGRPEVRVNIRDLARSDDSLGFPMFLALLCFLELLPTALQAVFDTFPFTIAAFADWIRAHPRLHGLLQTAVSTVANVDRVTAVFSWFESHDMPLSSFILFSLTSRSNDFAVVRYLMIHHNFLILPQFTSRRDWWAIGDELAGWLTSGCHDLELLQMALAHGVLNRAALTAVMGDAFVRDHSNVAAIIRNHVIQSDEDGSELLWVYKSTFESTWKPRTMILTSASALAALSSFVNCFVQDGGNILDLIPGHELAEPLTFHNHLFFNLTLDQPLPYLDILRKQLGQMRWYCDSRHDLRACTFLTNRVHRLIAAASAQDSCLELTSRISSRWSFADIANGIIAVLLVYGQSLRDQHTAPVSSSIACPIMTSPPLVLHALVDAWTALVATPQGPEMRKFAHRKDQDLHLQTQLGLGQLASDAPPALADFEQLAFNSLYIIHPHLAIQAILWTPAAARQFGAALFSHMDSVKDQLSGAIALVRVVAEQGGVDWVVACLRHIPAQVLGQPLLGKAFQNMRGKYAEVIRDGIAKAGIQVRLE